MEYRKKWEKNWDSVRYCSQSCRSDAKVRKHKDFESWILELTSQRETSLCPSEVARRIEPEHWRHLMEDIRRAARRLALRGEVAITQKGCVVSDMNFKGPIRLQRPNKSSRS